VLSLEDALACVAAALPVAPPAREEVALADARGRVLAADVRMDHDVPPFRRSTMDGYALGAGSFVVGQGLPVGGSSAAGDAPGARLAAGTAWRVMTGAPLPEGAARVVPFEWTDEGTTTVVLQRAPGQDTFLVERGEHAAAGDVVVPAGTRLAGAALGALATAGAVRVPVVCAPVVAVLGTGDELVPPDEQPGPGRIRNSNGPMLTALACDAGADGRDHGIAGDAPAALQAALGVALDGADVVLTSGGVSRGDHDLVPGLLEGLGVRCLFHRWAVQPGGPLWCGVRGDALVVGLPGNPAASRVGFELLVRPVLAQRLGRPWCARATVTARYAGPCGRAGPRRRYRPATITTDATGRLEAHALPWRGSGDPFSMALAPAWIVLPEDRDPPVDRDGVALVDVVVLEGP
jgi:molybdopterin molybdotransferase